MLQVSNISLWYGPRLVLDDVSFTLGREEKAGLIGINGAGKSTLLKIVADQMAPDNGTVTRPRTWGYLSQDVAHEDPVVAESTVRDYIFSGRGLAEALREYESLAQVLATASGALLDETMDRFGDAQATLERLGYYEAEARAEELVHGLGLKGVTLDRRVATLSGGQKTKLALARLLFQAPELLLLDEPTNFLDVQAAQWLMGFLGSYRGALLIISHDLDLLDRNIDKIMRLNEFTHKLEETRGTYSAYLRQTEGLQATLEKAQLQQHKEVTRLKKTAERLRGFGATRVMQVHALERRVETMERSMPVLASNSRRMKISFKARQPSGKGVLRAKGLTKSYGPKQVFQDISFNVERGQRLVVIGLNGAGKTTLLRSLQGLTTLDAGTTEWDDRVQPGYYAQENEGLDYNQTVFEEALSVLPEDSKRVRGVLGRFLFSGDRVTQQVGTLSGGEKTRLALAKLVLAGPNVLVLDEPTTHLDPVAREVVGEALADYDGTIVAVTHDVEFVAHLKPDTLLTMPGGQLLPYSPEHNTMLARS
ncbi:MAG TPA: ABC-F family ATP-binding cassette domain-containing protein [Chloroflexia bacterium]|nr:ABC-F family ATP-binding cassette domain-containing protein [Chloroflexia bacterium]